MKSLHVLVLLVLGSVAIAVTPRNQFEKGLLSVIEKCKKGDVQGLPIALPSLKLLNIPSMTTKRDGFTMTLRDVNIKGLEYLTVQKLSAYPSDLTMSLKFFIPTLEVRADRYHLKGKAMWVFAIDNTGIFECNINNIQVRADVQFKAKGRDTVVTNLNLDYSVDDIQVRLTGSSKLVNRRVKNRMSELINDSKAKGRIQDRIVNVAREILRGHTPKEFVEIISAV